MNRSDLLDAAMWVFIVVAVGLFLYGSFHLVDDHAARSQEIQRLCIEQGRTWIDGACVVVGS